MGVRGKCRIQFMSDLHLEHVKYEFDTEAAAPTLVLGGDIGRFCDYDAYHNFLRKQCEQFDKILLVPGNHEFYGSSREQGFEAAKKLVKDPVTEGKLVLMHRTRFDLDQDGVIVLGCTLQSHLGPDCKRMTNDFTRIKNWSVEQHNAEHQIDIEWLRSSLTEIAQDDPKKRVVIATHYAPAFEKTCHPKNERNAVSQCFSSDTLAEFQTWPGATQVTHWIFGHTHWNAKFKHGNTVVISNQRCNDSKDLSWLQKHMLYRPFDVKAIIQV